MGDRPGRPSGAVSFFFSGTPQNSLLHVAWTTRGSRERERERERAGCNRAQRRCGSQSVGRWEYPLSCRLRGWVMECIGMQHVLWLMWMAYPNQADSLQGFCSVNCTILAANDPGIGSGWQQSKQNWALPAVVGHWARMRSSDLCCVQGAPLHPFLPLALNGMSPVWQFPVW